MWGKHLTRNQQEPSFLVAFVDWLWARVAASVLWPIHVLAKLLLYRKIQSAIGISKVRPFLNFSFQLVHLLCYLYEIADDVFYQGSLCFH